MIVDRESIPATIRPSEGYNYITNGEVYTDFLYLGKNDEVENWSDTNSDGSDAPETEQETEQATEQDYLDALAELGVDTNEETDS